MKYYELYRKRLNRYGEDYQSRVQGQREKNFDDYLLKSIYRVDFEYNDNLVPATLERYKQDETETQNYLLTRRDIIIPNGTIINIIDAQGENKFWMVWWLEEIKSSGYNRYVVLKMTHLLTWRDCDGKLHEQWAYFSGPGTSKISDTVKSSTGEAIYKENNNLYMFITPYNKHITKDQYFEVAALDTKEGFVVMDMDIQSSPGIAYISIDPSYTRKQQENIAPVSWLKR